MPLLSTGRFFSAAAGGGFPSANLDPYPTEVVLLTDSENGVFAFDQAYGNAVLTSVGGVVSSAQAKFGTYSMFFDGVNDRYTCPDSSNWHPSGAYTWEAWIYPTSSIQSGTIASFYQSTGSENSWRFGISAPGTIHFTHVSSPGSGNVATSYNSVLAVAADQWSHVAVCFDGTNQIKFFINGVLDANVVTLPSGFTDRNSVLRIGSTFTGGAEASFFKGYIDGLRLTKGVARYTNSFAPPTVKFPTPPPKTLLAVNFTGANGSTSFTDIGPYARTLTAVGNAQIQSNKLELDGTGDMVTIPDSGLWTLTGVDMTIECFGVVADSVATSQNLFTHYLSTGNQRGWRWLMNTGRPQFTCWTDGSTQGDSLTKPLPALSAGVAYDLTFVREGTESRIYINGVLENTGVFDTPMYDSTAVLAIGAEANNVNNFDGRMAAIRLSRGALYSGASYSVPTLPLTG